MAFAVFLPCTLLATSFKQPGFTESVVFSGLVNPTTVRFLPDGSVLVAEKSGLIKRFASLTDMNPTVVVDLRVKVHNFWDRGLLGLAFDPNFTTNSYIYVLYSNDAVIGGIPPEWGPGDGTSDPCPTPPGATTDGCMISGHLSRLTAVGSDWTGSEQVLIEDWCQQFPSHSVGALGFGADGMLYISGGEGASFGNNDWGQFGGAFDPPTTPKNPCGDPPVPVGGDQVPPTAEGGSLRSQSPRRAAGEPRVLNGSVLRVDPATGAGVSGNPLFGSSDANERRIIGYGFRNPFTFGYFDHVAHKNFKGGHVTVGGIVYQGASYEGLTCDYLELAFAAGPDTDDIMNHSPIQVLHDRDRLRKRAGGKQ
jgi:glucose/arabinose dehydrogenase